MDLRDFDDAHNERIIQRIENEKKRQNSMIGAIVLAAIYAVVTTAIWGMFFYRGGRVEMGFEGYLLDAVAMGFIAYAVTDEKSSNRGLATFFGAAILLCGDVIAKSIILYPLIVNILGM